MRNFTSYKESLATTPYHDYSPLLSIKIDYRKLLAYAKEKGMSPSELSDDERNRFIVNSNMGKIREIRAKIGV